MDSPAFLYTKGQDKRANKANFMTTTRNDIQETIKFLYKRGMWSKYHYTQWLNELKDCESEETLHLWWDAIVSGAMFEVEPMLEARIEAMEEFEEDKVEQAKMDKRRTNLMNKKMAAKK